MEKGEAKYKYPSGNEIKYFSQDFIDTLQSLVNPLEGFFDALDTSSDEKISGIASAGFSMIRDIKNNMEKLNRAVEKSLGENIEIDIEQGTPDDFSGYLPNYLGATLDPVKKGPVETTKQGVTNGKS